MAQKSAQSSGDDRRDSTSSLTDGEEVERAEGKPAKVARKSADKAEEPEEETILCTPPDVFWPEPQIRLTATLHPCPKGLLPSDARFLKERADDVRLPATTYPKTVKAAIGRGFRAMEAPAFLGAVPPELKRKSSSWSLLLIVGPSGSGKTSLLRSLAKQMCPKGSQGPLYPAATWTPGKPIVEQFVGGFKDAQDWMCAVGLSSVPTWCKPFDVLSVGEKYRANVARALSDSMDAGGQTPLIFDEWTSELDRGVARSLCVSLRRRLDARRAAGHKHPPLLVATCHDDVETHLRPDAAIVCQAGQKPRVKYSGIENEAKKGQHRMRVQAVVRGIMEPLPPGGWLPGAWHIEKLKQTFTIRFVNTRYLSLHLPKTKGPDKATNILQLDDCDNKESKDIQINNLANSKDWLRVRMQDLGMELRVRMRSASKLDVQRREVEDASPLQKEVAEYSSARKFMNELAGEGKASRNTVTTFHLESSNRIRQVERKFDLNKSEKAVLKIPPKERTNQQKDIVQQLQQRVAQKLSEKEAELTTILGKVTAWGPVLIAERLSLLTSGVNAVFMDAESNEQLSSEDALLPKEPVRDVSHDYGGCKIELLKRAGWYVPAGIDDHNVYPGLVSKISKRCTPEFRLDPRKESRFSGLVHLASYVGEKDGSLNASSTSVSALEEAARLLDDGFSGLCVHIVPHLEGYEHNAAVKRTMKSFRIGVILGPSGSGKSSLATERFGRPFRVAWDEDVTALSHFSSLEEAEPALNAAALDLKTSMLPAGLLSGGERERATLARGLAEWASGRQKALVIEEFTSLVDRPTAHRIAQGVAAFVQSHPDRQGLVFLSCHTDIVGKDLLAPDWVFDTGEGRFMVLTADGSSNGSAGRACPPRKKLKCESKAVAQEENEGSLSMPASSTVLKRPASSDVLEIDENQKAALKTLASSSILKRPASSDSCESHVEQEVVLKKPASSSVLKRPASSSSSDIANIISAKPLELTVRRALPCEWRHFREHHYKDHRLNGMSVNFVGVFEDRPVVFCSCINTGLTIDWMLARDDEKKAKKMKKDIGIPAFLGQRQLLREHRTVVLPDSQGLGLGSLIADAMAHTCTELGYSFMSCTAHPTYGGYRNRSKLWVALPSSQRERPGFQCSTFSHVWVGARDKESSKVLQDRVSFQGLSCDCIS
jgi:ABC-type hemin transport system ATPase subunit